METGLFTVLSLAALDAFLDRRINWCAIWLGLAGVTQPEGLILTCVSGAALLIDIIIHRCRINWRSLFALSCTFLAGLLPMILNYVLSGTYISSGLIAKSWIGNVSAYPAEILNSILLTFRRIILGRFLGQDWYVLPGLLLFGLWGWIRLLKDKLWLPLLVTTLWFFLGTASTASLTTSLLHRGRNQIPFIPILIVVSIYGLGKAQDMTAPRWQKISRFGAILILFILSLYSTGYYLDIYRRAVSTVTRQQLVISDWISDNLPEHAIVGIHDAGSLRYVGGRATYDLIGLTTPNAAIAWRHGAGSVYELMEQSPLRPTYFAIYPDVFSIPYLAATDLFAQKLFEVNVPDHLVASAGPIQAIWLADWHLANSGQHIIQPDILMQTKGMITTDSIDIADLTDETGHNMSWWHDDLVPGFPTEVQQQDYHDIQDSEVLDGGRLVTGGIAFDLSTEPGVDLWLVARLHPREAGSVLVRADNIVVGQWAYPPIPGEWLETLFHIPSNIITGETTRIELDVDNEVSGFKHYALYFLWALQGQSNTLTVSEEI